MRLLSAGGGPTFALIEVANGRSEIPSREMDAPIVRAPTEMAILVAALDNDRLALAKEIGRGQTDQNIYAVLASTGHSIEAVERHVTALRDHVLTLSSRSANRSCLPPALSWTAI